MRLAARKRFLALLVAAVAALAAFGAGSAQAAPGYPQLEQWDGSETPFGFVYYLNANSFAFDGANNLYVADGGFGVVHKFDSSHKYLATLDGSNTPFENFGGGKVAVAVDRTSGRVYVSDGGHHVVHVFNSAGGYITTWDGSNTPQERFSEATGPLGITVDQTNGDVYVIDTYNGVVDRFDPSGNFLSQFDGSETPAGSFSQFYTEGIAVDHAAGKIYVSDSNTPESFTPSVYVFDLGGNLLATWDGSNTPQGHFEYQASVDVNLENHDVYVTSARYTDPAFVYHFSPSGAYKGRIEQPLTNPTSVAVEPGSGHLYIGTSVENKIQVFGGTQVPLPALSNGPEPEVAPTSATVHANASPDGGPDVTKCEVEYKFDDPFELNFELTAPCSPATPYSSPQAVTAELTGLQPETEYRYRFVVANSNGPTFGETRYFTTAPAVADLSTGAATGVLPESATLNGSLDPKGKATEFFFEYGLDESYGQTTTPGDAGAGVGATPVSTPVTGLTPGTVYHYRVVAENEFGTTRGQDVTFTTSVGPPVISDVAATKVRSASALIHSIINPGGDDTTYHVEYGTTTAYGTSVPVPEATLPPLLTDQIAEVQLTGLQEGTEYHFKIVATSPLGVTETPDHVFSTFSTPSGVDECPNVLARKQTGAAFLLDCRAYELASAADTGGYDVESDLIPDGDPLDGHPLAADPSQVLYSLHTGSIPGIGSPTGNQGDPYVASRGAAGWSTRYVGIPAAGSPSLKPFASTLIGSGDDLRTFAFGGADLCSPCFGDGSAGIPVTMPNGQVVQGMAGSEDPGPAAAPSGYVARPLSADGRHLVFGSTSKFEDEGNEGSLTIYHRDLVAGTTAVVSRTPEGTTMTGSGIAELDISADGSRILIGRLVSTDAEGNDYWHLYMNVDDAGQTIDLTPGATLGVLYGGMSSEGTEVYFAAPGPLPGDDVGSADVYRADVGTASSALTRVSTVDGGTCNPVPNSAGNHWNEVGSASAASCGAVMIAGSGGVAGGDGSAYLISPQQLDGSSGTANQPNLYLSRPGQAPRFVATLEPDNPAVLDAVADSELRRYSDFQISRSGDYAVFVSTLPLTGFENDGRVEVFRYDAPASSLACVSCNPTQERPTTDASLPGHGSALTDDGRVFFNSREGLVLRDSNERQDAYEWSDGEIELISTGLSPFDSSVLSVGSSGTDAFFFTRDKLVPQDLNGQSMKIYDARSGGGFFQIPAKPQCAASDECHGPGTQAPGVPDIGSFTGTRGNAEPQKHKKKKKKRKKHHAKKKHSKKGKHKAKGKRTQRQGGHGRG